MLNIDNKIYLLLIWRYTSKPFCYFTFLLLQQTTADSNKALHQQCAICNNQTAIFRLNLLKKTVATAAFVRSPQNTSVSDHCG